MDSNGKKGLISFVIPCYRSEDTIGIVVGEIKETMSQRPEYPYEIILVNDGSPDNVWEVIKKLAGEDERITGVNLSKNFGQNCAIMAGYRQAEGDLIVSLDDDGQKPPAEVFKLIDKINEGYDVVFASYPKYHQTWFRRWGSSFSMHMTRFIFGSEAPVKSNSYYVMRRFVKEEIIRYDHPYSFLSGLIFRTTGNISTVPVQHKNRLSGTSGYSFKALVSLWLNGFTAFSVKPLELGAYLGFFFAIFGFFFAIITIIRKMMDPDIVAGWSSMISAFMIIGGIIMLMLGLIGEYIGRIYICLNNAPQYVVREIINNKQQSHAEAGI